MQLGIPDLTQEITASKWRSEIVIGGETIVDDGIWKTKSVYIPVVFRAQRKKVNEARFRHELRMWHQTFHPNIVPLYGSLVPSAGDQPCLIMPLIPEGTLEDYYKRGRPVPETRKCLVMEVAHALTYLHSISFVHGDLRAKNILVTHVRVGRGLKLRALLCDFGHASYADHDLYQSLSPDDGSPNWRAWELYNLDGLVAKYPSITREEAKSTLLQKADVWSWAMLVLEVFEGSYPYHYYARHEIIKALTMQELPKYSRYIVAVNGLEDALRQHLGKCWRLDPRKRPSMQDICARFPIRVAPWRGPKEYPWRTGNTDRDENGMQILFYAKTKGRWIASFSQQPESGRRMSFSVGDIVAVTKVPNSTGWLEGTRFIRDGPEKPLWRADTEYIPEREGSIHGAIFPFACRVPVEDSSSAVDVININREKDEMVLITGMDGGQFHGFVLKEDQKQRNQLFPAHYVRRLPTSPVQGADVEFYALVIKDFSGELEETDKTALMFGQGHVVQVKSAPEHRRWQGLLYNSQMGGVDPGSFNADGVESSWFDEPTNIF